jgi:NAD(P)H-flavin reductase/ferredoxin
MFKFFEKKQFQLTVDDCPAIELEYKETILNGAIRSDINFPHSCKAGGCAACKCKLISGKVKELTNKSYILSKEELDQGFILGCQSIPRSNVVIQLPSDTQQTYAGTVIEQRKLSHDISEIIIRLETAITYAPGQFAQVSAAGLPYPERSYSFAHATAIDIKGHSSISFFVRAIPNGKMSNWLHSQQALGASVNIKSSFGDFHLRQGDSPMICMAGGSGLAPLISILEHALIQNKENNTKPHIEQTQRNVVLIMGARTQQDLYYQAEIAAIQAQWPGSFTYLPVLSQEPSDSDWQGPRGFATELLESHITKNTEGYFCGPPAMIDAALEKMQGHGIDKNKLYFDKFSDQGR